MSAHPKSPQPSLGEQDDDVNVACVLRVPCPGKAHRRGEPCLICDEDDDGTISILVTHAELDAIGCAAQGRPVDVNLAPRLLALGLLHELAGITAPTERGYGLLRGPRN